VIWIKISFAALLAVLSYIFIDFEIMWLYISAYDFNSLFIALVLISASYAVACVKWVYLARAASPATKPLALVDMYFLGLLGNLWLPSGFVGDVGRASLLVKEGINIKTAGLVVLMDRATSFLPIALAAVFGFEFLLYPSPVLAMVSVVLIIVAYLLAIYLLPRKVFAPGRQRGFNAIWVITSLASTALLFLAYVPLIKVYGKSIAEVLPLVPFSLATVVVPISFGGWGLREASLGAAMEWRGMDAEIGISISGAVGVLAMVSSIACFAAVRLALGTRRK
jgi:glycosyltransferase 2 family protein